MMVHLLPSISWRDNRPWCKTGREKKLQVCEEKKRGVPQKGVMITIICDIYYRKQVSRLIVACVLSLTLIKLSLLALSFPHTRTRRYLPAQKYKGVSHEKIKGKGNVHP